jgi:hypothetical protein
MRRKDLILGEEYAWAPGRTGRTRPRGAVKVKVKNAPGPYVCIEILDLNGAPERGTIKVGGVRDVPARTIVEPWSSYKDWQDADQERQSEIQRDRQAAEEECASAVARLAAATGLRIAGDEDESIGKLQFHKLAVIFSGRELHDILDALGAGDEGTAKRLAQMEDELRQVRGMLASLKHHDLDRHIDGITELLGEA